MGRAKDKQNRTYSRNSSSIWQYHIVVKIMISNSDHKGLNYGCCCVTLGKICNLFLSQFFHLSNGNNNRICLI